MTLTVDGYCHRCRKPLGKVAWDSADYVFHRKCAKAEEVYTPPPRPSAPYGFFSLSPLMISHDCVNFHDARDRCEACP